MNPLVAKSDLLIFHRKKMQLNRLDQYSPAVEYLDIGMLDFVGPRDVG